MDRDEFLEWLTDVIKAEFGPKAVKPMYDVYDLYIKIDDVAVTVLVDDHDRPALVN